MGGQKWRLSKSLAVRNLERNLLQSIFWVPRMILGWIENLENLKRNARKSKLKKW